MANPLITLCEEAGFEVVKEGASQVRLFRCVWTVQAQALSQDGRVVFGGAVFGGPITTPLHLQNAVVDQVCPPKTGNRTPLTSFSVIPGVAMGMRGHGTPPRSHVVIAMTASEVAQQGAVLIDVAASKFIRNAAENDPDGREAEVLREARRQGELLLLSNDGFVATSASVVFRCQDRSVERDIPELRRHSPSKIDLRTARVNKHTANGLAVKVTGEGYRPVDGFNRTDVEEWLRSYGVRIHSKAGVRTRHVITLPLSTTARWDGKTDDRVITLERFINKYKSER